MSTKNKERLEGVAIGVASTLLAAVLVWAASGIWARVRGAEAELIAWTSTWTPEMCQGYIVPGGTLSSVPPPEDLELDETWASRVGAVAAGAIRITVDLQGQTQQAVVLDGLTVVRESEPEMSTSYSFFPTPPGCGGPLEQREFDVDLSSTKPVATAHDFGKVEKGLEKLTTKFPYQISVNDPEQFIIHGNLDTAGKAVAFHLEIPWHSKRDRGVLLIRNVGGKPFVAAGKQDLKRYYYADEGKWKRGRH